MKKKSLITMLVSLSLVAVVGVGATLAYLSDSTLALENTFVVGSDINIDLVEHGLNGTEEIIADAEGTLGGVKYEDLQPGDLLKKDPFVRVKTVSNDCYLFMYVEGLDELEAIGTETDMGSNFAISTTGNTSWNHSSWKKVANLDAANAPIIPTVASPYVDDSKKDGVYQFLVTNTDITKDNIVIKTTDADFNTAPLFDTITYKSTVTEPLTADINSAKITVKACAVQAANLSDDDGTALGAVTFQ